MGMALELVAAFDLDAAAAFGAMTVATGNSFTIRNAPLNTKVYLATMWFDAAIAAQVRVRSPRLHDNVQGLRFSVPINDPGPLFSPMVKQILQPQDTLVVEDQAADAATDVHQLGMLVYYEDLPGVQARLARPEFVVAHMQHTVTVENTITTTATGDYGGEEALNAEFDLLKANTDYALIGYTVSARCGNVRWRGADTGNLGVGGPGSVDDQSLTSGWFIWLAQMSGLACIPIFNSANRAGILLDATQDDAGADVTVNSILVELKP